MAQLVASVSGVVLGGVAEVVGSNLASGSVQNWHSGKKFALRANQSWLSDAPKAFLISWYEHVSNQTLMITTKMVNVDPAAQMFTLAPVKATKRKLPVYFNHSVNHTVLPE